MRYSILFFFVSCCCFISCAQENSVLMFPCSEKLESPYGICAHFTHKKRDVPTMNEQIKLMQNARIQNVRYDFWVPYTDTLIKHELISCISQSVRCVNKQNIEPLCILFGGWRNQRAWQRKPQYFLFLEHLISNYAKKVKYWEIMNEVNLTAKEDSVPLDSTVKWYTDMLSLSYLHLKKANPNCMVTSSGLADVNDDFLELMCKRKSYDYFDVLNIHTYDAPEKIPEKLRKIRDLMDKYKWSKPVWITECGMPTNYDKNVKPWFLPNEQRETEQAYRIPRMYIISFAYGVDKVFTYKLRAEEKDRFYTEDHFGIVHADLTPKPAYIAYQTLTKMLPSGSSRPTLTKDGNTYFSYWKRPDKKKIWAIWCSSEKKRVKIEVTGKADFYDYLGNKIYVSENLEIGKGVTFVVGAKSVKIVS